MVRPAGSATHGERLVERRPRVAGSSLRRAEGALTRTAALNQQLRAGREARYEADLRLLRDCEVRWIEGRGRQSDGAHMRLGRVGQVSSWRHSGFLHQRGRIMTWHWQRSYWVLHNGLLWGFNGSFLGARLRLVLPILGAKLGKTPPSSRAHPFSFTVTINPYFMEDELLATTEFAAPSLAERVAWMQILNETACKVSKMFRRTADKVAHVHSVDVQDASAALWEVREHLETQQL